MNPKLVEEVARAIYESMDLMDKLDTTAAEIYAQAAIRVCMARAAEIAEAEIKARWGDPVRRGQVSDAIKREGGLT